MSINRSPSCDFCRHMNKPPGDCAHPDRGEKINDMLYVQQIEISKVLGGDWWICSGFNYMTRQEV